MINSKMVIGVSVFCVILAVAFFGTSLYFTSLINNKDLEISDLNSQINDLNTQITNLNSPAALQTTEIWLDDENVILQSNSSTIWNRTIEYPGYLRINKIGGGSTVGGGEIYFQITYWSDPVYFEQKHVIGTTGILAFPVLPTSNLEFKLGYDNPINATADIRVTISYGH
jgi:hypothetical protein